MRNPVPEDEPIPTHEEPESSKRHGIFGSLRREPSPTPSTATSATNATGATRNTTNTINSHAGSHDSGGLFRRSTDAGSTSGRSFLHRSFGHGSGSASDAADLDPSIVQARERVLSAESAEREADRALDIARREVREAREQVQRLGLEAKEEARRAKIKQYHAHEISRRAKPLGREYLVPHHLYFATYVDS